MKNLIILNIILYFNLLHVFSQPVPAKEENIPFLVTFGKEASTDWGDDDKSQTLFLVIPKSNNNPFFIRVFDPETSGKHDELKAKYNTKTKISVYGGKGCISVADARKTNPVGNYRSGKLLTEKTFYNEPKYDNTWFTFRPFSPLEGELSSKYGGNVFKIIIQGTQGDDGNLYRFYMSTSSTQNIPIEGGNVFMFEYSFRLHDDISKVSHLYPYLDDRVISIKQSNFDWDYDGKIVFNSVQRYNVQLKASPDNKWIHSEHKIFPSERGSSIDIQLRKNKIKHVKNNNVVFYVRNQYDELLPFYTIPIGGIPIPKSKIGIKTKR